MAGPGELDTTPPNCPVQYWEEAAESGGGWPKSLWNDGNFAAERHLLCDWADRDELLTWLFTYPNDIYPYIEGPPSANIKSIGIEGMGKQGWEDYVPGDGLREPMYLAKYEKARLIVKYSSILGGYSGGIRVAEQLRPVSIFKTYNPSTFKWASDDVVLQEPDAVQRQYHTFHWVVTYYNVMDIASWVINKIGTCNSNVVGAVVLPFSFDPQTLLFQAPTVRGTRTTGNVRRWDVTVHLAFRPGGWNTHWRKETGQYEAIELLDGTPFIQYPAVLYVAPT